MSKITVAVSPFYTGRGWYDEYVNIEFLPSQSMYPVEINKKYNLTGVANAIRLNHLLLLEGTLDVTDYEEVDSKNELEGKIVELEATIVELQARIKELEGAQAVATAVLVEEENLEDKTLTELKAIAKERGIDVQGTKKADYLKALQ